MLLSLLLSAFALASAPVDGAYHQPCWLLNNEDPIDSTLQVAGDVWTRIRTGYEQNGCKTPWIAYRDTFTASLGEGENLNLTMKSATYEPLSQEVADALNLMDLCGRADWKANVEVDVTGQQCEDYPVPAAGAVVYSRYREAATGAFAIGIDSPGHDGTSEAARYQDVEPSAYQKAQ